MLFGWRSVRHMRRGLPNSELVKLEKFYYDYLRRMGLAKTPDEAESSDNPPLPDNWESEQFPGEFT